MKCYSKPGWAAAAVAAMAVVGGAEGRGFLFSLIRIDWCFLEFSRRLGLIVNRYFISNRAAAEQRSLSTMKPVRPREASYEALSIRLGGCEAAPSPDSIATPLWCHWPGGACWLNSPDTRLQFAVLTVCASPLWSTTKATPIVPSSYCVSIRLSETGVNPLCSAGQSAAGGEWWWFFFFFKVDSADQ